MSSAASSTDVGTPVHVPSRNDRGDDYYLPSEHVDLDEAIDLDDHVTSECGHVIKLSGSDDSNEDSTAEEGLESLPNYESTTTDNIPEHVEPVDFIETNPRLHPPHDISYHANGALISNHGNRYENWSVELQLDDGSKKGTLPW